MRSICAARETSNRRRQRGTRWRCTLAPPSRGDLLRHHGSPARRRGVERERNGPYVSVQLGEHEMDYPTRRAASEARPASGLPLRGGAYVAADGVAERRSHGPLHHI